MTGDIYGSDLILGYNSTTPTITTDDANETLYIDPNGSGSVGIGTVSSGDIKDLLSVVGNVAAKIYRDWDNTNFYFDPADSALALVASGDITTAAQIGIGTTAPTNAIDIVGAATINATGALTISSGGNINLNPGGGSPEVNVGGSGAGKINVGTVDPPYTIGGQRYATYMPSMVGVKEEVTGVANTTENVPGVGYRSIIDFGRLTTGTDLWLFSKTTDLKTNIDKLVVILNPSGNTRAWYDLDTTNYRLAIYTSQPSRVSYRFTAPRFDYQSWQNTRTNAILGFDISGLTPITASEAPLATPSANIIGDLSITTTTTPSTGLLFDLKDSLGAFIYDVGKFSQAAVANLKAGWLAVDTITPLATNTDGIDIKLGATQKLAITDSTGTPKTTFDQLGNATLSGQLESKDVVVHQNATFEGNIIQTGGVNALPDQGSMVANGGFEVNNDGNASMPDTWTCNNTGTSTGSCSRDTINKSQGNASLAVIKNNTTDQLQVMSNCVPITGGSSYNVNMRIRSSVSLSKTQHYVGLWGYATETDCKNNSNATPYMTGVAATTSWSSISRTTGILGSSVSWARAGTYITGAAATISVDALRLIPSTLNESMDIAENYYVSTPLTAGTIAQIAATNDSTVEKALNTTSQSLIGIVSTSPAITLGEGVDPEMLTPIALSGRVPAIVSDIDGTIANGDPITASSIAGVGAKTVNAGATVGKALQTFDPSTMTCQDVASVDNIIWPDDDGTNKTRTCFTLPDGTHIGKIMTFINVSWFAPEVTQETKTKTLYADRIITSFGELTATPSSQTINYITNVTNIIATPSSEYLGTPTVDTTPTLDASTAALLAQLSDSVATFTSETIDLSGRAIIADSVTLHDSLSVLGNTTLGETSIAGSLLVDATVRMSQSGIETISDTLYLNKTKFANVDILAGTMVITTTGDVLVTGNLAVTGNVAIGGTLGVSTIRPNTEDLTINLEKTSSASAFGKLIVKGAADKTVTIDQNGNITASGSATVARLNITGMDDPTSTIAATATSSATIGTGIVRAGTKEVTVATTAITDQSLIYVTPITSTNNQVLYVKTKTAGAGFTVNMDTDIPQDVRFNWWIVN